MPLVKTEKDFAAEPWTVYQSQALDDGQVVLNGAGRLKSITAVIGAAAATDVYYLQAADASAVPADGAVTLVGPPIEINHTLGTQSSKVLDFSPTGFNVSAGVTVWISTTEITKTLAGAVAMFTVEYKPNAV